MYQNGVFLSMSHYQRAYRTIIFGILCIVSMHATLLSPSERKSMVPHEKCDCRRNVADLPYVPSTKWPEVAEAFARLPIAIQSGTSFPLIKLICEYSPWFLVSRTDFSKSWITENGVDRAVTGCDHVKGVALNYAWKAAGSGRICDDLWYYLGGADVVFNRNDIARLKAMTLLKNDAVQHKGFEFESLCGRHRNIYTQGVSFEQYAKLDVVSHISACLKAQKEKEQKENESCSIL